MARSILLVVALALVGVVAGRVVLEDQEVNTILYNLVKCCVCVLQVRMTRVILLLLALAMVGVVAGRSALEDPEVNTIL